MKNYKHLFQNKLVLIGFFVVLSALLSVLTYFFNMGIQDLHLFFVMLAFTLAFALVALKVETFQEKKTSSLQEEESLQDDYYDIYQSIKDHILQSSLLVKQKRDSTQDILKIFIDAQNNKKDLGLLIPDPIEYAEEIVEAYGLKQIGLSQFLEGLWWGLLFLTCITLFFERATIFKHYDGYYHIAIDPFFLLTSFLIFLFPFVRTLMQRYYKIKIGLVVLLYVIPINLLYQLYRLYVLYNKLYPRQIPLSFDTLKLIYYLAFLGAIYILWLLREKFSHFSYKFVDRRRLNEKKAINAIQIINAIFFSIIAVSAFTVYWQLLNHPYSQKNIYNDSLTSQNTLLQVKDLANQNNTNFYQFSGLPDLKVGAWKASFEQNILEEIYFDGTTIFAHYGINYNQDLRNYKKIGYGIYAISPDNGSLQWSFKKTAENGLIITADMIFFGDGISLYALRKNDGELLWRHYFKEGVRGNLALDKGKVFAKDFTGTLHALDAISGKALWSVAYDYPSSCNPAIANDILYFLNAEGFLYAVSTHDGHEVWKAKIDRNDGKETMGNEQSSYQQSTIIFHNDTLFVVQKDSIFQVDALDGKELWQFNLDAYEFGVCAVENDILYVNCIALGDSNKQSMTIAIDLLTKQEVWGFELKEGSYPKRMALASNKLYFCSKKYLYAVDAKTGKALWKYHMLHWQGIQQGDYPFAIGNGAIYIGNIEGKYLCALK
jgi:outer membrane protein assembly factor BamB